MTTPFDKIGINELAPTCTAIADAHGTSEHAAWIRRPGNAAALVTFIDSYMGGVNVLRVELFENERGTSNCGPPPGWVPKPYGVQRRLLRETWSNLQAPPSVEALLTPYTAADVFSDILMDGQEEGFFFGPKFSSIARIAKGNKGLPDYHRALKHLFGMLSECRPDFKDLADGRIGERHEQPIQKWWKRRMAYEATIKGDFVAYMGQTGIAYRNWSIRAARADMEQGRCRVGMTSLDVAQILLSHGERLTKSEHLAIDCAGTETAPHGDGDFRRASHFSFYVDELNFSSDGVARQAPRFGSASFRLPGVGQASSP